MKIVNIIVFLLFLGFGAKSTQAQGEETHYLNGVWKFNTFMGDGSSYRDIKPEANDIIIDNADAKNVKVVGSWATSAQGDRGSIFYAKNYLKRWFKAKDKNSYVTYTHSVPTTGYYEHFFFFPFASHLTQKTTIKHADGDSIIHNNQRTRCGQWISLGVFKIKKEDGISVSITAISEGGVSADAVMIRKVSDKHFEAAQADKSKAIATNYDDSSWHNLQVPGHWGMINKYSGYTGKGWYRKEVELPRNWKKSDSERIRIRFEAVYHLAKIYLNGKPLGEHRGGFTPFEFDITDKVKFGEKNVLVVEADNNFIVGATWNWGGIIRDVKLIKTPDVRISYQYVHADPDLETGVAALKLKVRIENKSSEVRKLKLQARVSDKKVLTKMKQEVEVEANSIKEFDLEEMLKAKQVKLWHFDSPHLYTLETSISEGRKKIHSRKDRFGIRKVEITETQFKLNGEPVRLAGFNRVSEHRYWGSAEQEDIMRLDVDLMKHAGANFMRIMHGTQHSKLIELCDEKGILIFEEINVRELTNPELTPPEYPLAKQWIREMIERDCNHASIIGWSTGNELKEHNHYVTTTTDYVRKIDPYRLASYVSNNGHRKKDTPENNPLTVVDFILQNVYMPTPDKMLDPIHERWPNKPVFFSEFGVGRFSAPTLDGDLPQLTKWYESIRGKNTWVVGASLWTYNDYRSAYAQTLEEENRSWGLVNVWRQKRRLFARQQRENSPVKDIRIEEFNVNSQKVKVEIPIRGVDDYPNFTMNDYKLMWEFQDVEGTVLEKNQHSLPVLKPQDGSWSGEITWGRFKGKAQNFTIRLVTPNGYTRFQKTVQFEAPAKPKITTAIAADGAIRLCFDKIFSAEEYYVKCTNKGGQVFTSKKSIDRQIDVDSLQNGQNYKVELIACNAIGESTSESLQLAPKAKILPPVIWDAFITNNKLVVGYSGQIGDEIYTVRYGSSENNLNKEFTSNVRGLMSIDLDKEKVCFFKLRRNNAGKISEWSNVFQAK